ncbi:MAG: glycosyltransferase [Bacteroidales bacterium]|nr:glycosyltransferase [Bacteroidales bacterium]
MIVIISPTESVLTKRGQRHPNFAKYLVNQGENILYVTTDFYHAEKRIFQKKEIEHALKATPYPIKFLHIGSYKKNISFKRFLWCIILSIKAFSFLIKRIKKDDVLMVPSRPTELLTLARILKFLKQCKVVVDVEDVWPDAFLIKNKLLKSLFFLYCNIHNKYGMKACDLAFYVSPNFIEWINRYHPNTKKIFTPIGIEENYIVKKIETYIETPKKIKLLYIGSLQFQIDLLPLCKAMLMNKNRYQLTLIGENGKGQRFQEVMNFLQDNDIDFINKGILSRDEVFKELQNAHITVVPMISGGLPKKFFDSIGSAKPLLIIGEGGAASEVKSFNLGWVVDNNPNHIFQTLETIDAHSLNEKSQQIFSHLQRYKEITSMKTMYNEIKTLYSNYG